MFFVAATKVTKRKKGEIAKSPSEGSSDETYLSDEKDSDEPYVPDEESSHDEYLPDEESSDDEQYMPEGFSSPESTSEGTKSKGRKASSRKTSKTAASTKKNKALSGHRLSRWLPSKDTQKSSPGSKVPYETLEEYKLALGSESTREDATSKVRPNGLIELEGMQPPEGKKKRQSANFIPRMTASIKGPEDTFETNLEDNQELPPEILKEHVPDFMQPKYIRDTNGNRPSDPDYDPTTLFVPEEFLKQETLSSTHKQYWKLKAKNYDKILLFKYGRFYEIYYNDAIICHQILSLNWVGNRLQVGIPERSFDYHVQKLVDNGHRVAVVEQLETIRGKEEKVKNNETNKESRLTRRDTVQILSKGTFAGKNYTSFEPRYFMTIQISTIPGKGKRIGVTFIDITTNTINLGFIHDDEHLTKFKLLISQIRPSEVIYEDLENEPLIKTVLSSSSISPLFSPLKESACWTIGVAQEQLNQYFGTDEEKWPQVFKDIKKFSKKDYELVMMAFGGCVSYMKRMLLLDRVLSARKFVAYDPQSLSRLHMILDSQALQHLEICNVEYSAASPTEGSLFGFLNRTCTPFGERMLKRWLCAPLLDPKAINERLDAIEELQKLGKVVTDFRTGIGKLPDLERMLTRVYSYGVRQAFKPIMFEDISLIRLREYQIILNNIRAARNMFVPLTKRRDGFKSKILQDLTNLKNFTSLSQIDTSDTSIVPDPFKLTSHFEELIKWEGEKGTYKLATPKPGIDTEYDNIKKDIESIHKTFEAYLGTIRERFDCKGIKYSNAKYRFELEIPIHLVEGKKKPPEFIFTSQKKGYQRFHTKEIKQIISKLEKKETLLKQSLSGFVASIFEQFRRYASVWDRFVSVIAQLDCLAALSLASAEKGKMTRPVLYPLGTQPFFYAKGLRHPCLSKKGSSFVPNDIVLGKDPTARKDESASPKDAILLTGPNMGGKSTLLRQVCVAAILAQIGCYVPAQEFRMSMIDRIFTRIGASDNLMEGKSTFYIEMEETKSALIDATSNSLIIMDELGRGTSTYDGLAIAYSVMKYLVEVTQCRVLFATHYHALIDEFEGEYENLGFYFMDCHYDPKTEKVLFKYKLKEGRCPRSFGIQVAIATGLPKEVIERAKQVSADFETKTNLSERVTQNKKFKKEIEWLISLN
mgnify:CR=1 FL=1